MSSKRRTRRPTPAQPPTSDRLLTTAEAAHLLGRNPRTLENWRARSARIPYAVGPSGRFIGYRERDVQEYIASLPVVEVVR